MNEDADNGDGRNDYFHPLVRGIVILVRSFLIYDRWGKKVWDTVNGTAASGWDGTCNGIPTELGVYFYSISIETHEGEKTERAGEGTLVR